MGLRYRSQVHQTTPNANPVTIVKRVNILNYEGEQKDANPFSAVSFCSVQPTTCKTQNSGHLCAAGECVTAQIQPKLQDSQRGPRAEQCFDKNS